MLKGKLGFKGERGYSAYEIAVQHGYEGTEEQWVEDFINAENYYDKTESYNKTEVYNKSEVYNKEESDSKYILKGDFAIISDHYTAVEGETYKQITLEYPTGFTKDNCIVTSVMMRNSSQQSQLWGNGCVMTLNSTSTGEVLSSVSLFPDSITLYLRNVYARAYTDSSSPQINEQQLPNLDYKIVLMKIGESND